MLDRASPVLPLDDPCAADTRNLYALVDAMSRAPTPEERTHLAAELRAAFDAIRDVGQHNVRSFQNDHAHERGPAVAALVSRLQANLVSPSQSTRLAAISALAALITTDSESMNAKMQRTSNAIRILYSTPVTDILTARAAAHLVADFSDLNNPLSDRSVEAVLFNAMTLITAANFSEKPPRPQLSMDRARAVMVVKELTTCQNVHPAIFENQERLRLALWLVVWDCDPAVRAEGVRCMHAILHTLVVRSEKHVARAAIDDTMCVIRRTLRKHPNTDPNRTPFSPRMKDVASTHGSLAMLVSLLRVQETKALMLPFAAELCDFALPYQSCKDPQVRHAVADILPLVVQLDRKQFAVAFLDTVQTSTLKLIRDTKFPGDERGRSLVSLGAIAEQMPTDIDITNLMTNVLQECRKSLCERSACRDRISQIPQADVISTIFHVTKAYRGSVVLERELRSGLLSGLFQSDFTNELVIALDSVGRAVPVFAKVIRSRLVHLIAATLNSRLPNRMYGVSASDQALCMDSENRNSKQKRPETPVSRTRSFLSLTAPAAKIASPPRRNRENSLPPHGLSLSSEELRLKRQASSREFFRQVPISEELHRVDSSTVLAFKSSAISLEGLLKGSRRAQTSFQTYRLGDTSSLVVEDDVGSDKENSPCVALKAIVIYEFTGMKVSDFCFLTDEFVIGYVEHNRVKVRALAVAASAKLMVGAVHSSRREGNHLISKVHATLSQFLSIAVADPSTDVRFVTIRALDNPLFYPYLLQPEMLAKLFICFHDKSLAMREAALSLTGRLSRDNPAHVLPPMRHYFMHLMRVLKCDGEWFASDRREAAELVYALVHNATHMIVPYTRALIHALQVRLTEAQHTNDTSSALPVLLTIAEMGGTMSKIDLKPYQDEMIPMLVDSVLDRRGADSLYRKATLRALTAFVQNTGFVIKPYAVHSALLPELMQLLKSENDASIRILAEILLGTLGAVDPVDNKYASIADYHGRGPSLSERAPGNGSQGRSIFKRDASGINIAAQWSSFGHLLTRQGRGQGTAGPSVIPDHGHPLPLRKFGEGRASRGDVNMNTGFAVKQSSDAQEGDLGTGAAIADDSEPSLTWFGSGGTELSEKIRGYQPCWAAVFFPRDSLITLLEHPFTASLEYFPSVALDSLHRIIAEPKLHLQHREACQAIVNILKSLGAKCSNFLTAAVPRMLLLLVHSAPKDSTYPGSFSQLQQHVIQRLGDIVSTAGFNFMPFTFDTVLLIWRYLHTARNSVGCITSICGLLSKLRMAIGDDFQPILATILPPLLCALVQDSSANGIITKAILHTLESFGVLLEDYREIVLINLTKVVLTRRTTAVREDVLRTVILLLNDMQSSKLISGVVHPLLQVLAGMTDAPYLQSDFKKREGVGLRASEQGFEKAKDIRLAPLAAVALTITGTRAKKDFEVFVPVVAKALRASNVREQNSVAYRQLKALLMRYDPIVVGELLPEEADGELATEPLFSGGGFDSLRPGMNFELQNEMNGFGISSPPGSHFNRTSHQESMKLHPTRVHVAEHALAAKWDVRLNSRSEDWITWMDSLGAAMFAQSGSPAFRACARIAETYPPFTKELFNAVFLSCWSTVLSQSTRTKICDSLEMALSSETIPLNVLQAILNLFEYMDHDEKPLPACSEKLAPTACKCGAFAKAIRYREQEYSQHLGNPEQLKEDIYGEDGLIAIYEKLGHIESAVGTIAHYQEHTNDIVQEEWLEKLQRWDDALSVYERTDMQVAGSDRAIGGSLSDGDALYNDGHKWSHLLGKLRCLNELGEWRQMNALLQKTKISLIGNNDALRQLAVEGNGASVAFDLGRWDEFEEWVGFMRPDSYDGCFYSTLLSVKRGKDNPIHLVHAENFLYEARCRLDLELTARVSEAYPRAYAHVVNAQLLVELEEMIAYLRVPQCDMLFGKQRLNELWSERLRGCKQDRFTWYRLLMIRALVMSPIDTKDQWLEFATMCRKTCRLPMASAALRMLVTSFKERSGISDATTMLNPGISSTHREEWDEASIMNIEDLDIKFACIKHMWAIDKRIEAYSTLQHCRREFWGETDAVSDDTRTEWYSGMNPRDERRILASEVFSKLSKWGDRLLENKDEQCVGSEDPLRYAERATQIRPDWYKAWHYWGTLNASRFEELMEQEKVLVTAGNDRSKKAWHVTTDIKSLRIGQPGRMYLMEAVKGYFRAINLEGKTRLEDALKVLTLWFNYGGHSSLHIEFDKHFEATNIAMWLEVVPQVIARLYSPHSGVQRGVKSLLTRIGKEHPQVAVYPLTVAKSAVRQGYRRQAAEEILDDLRDVHPDIVEQSELVSRELIRSAILWTEMWYERLEEASKLYFVEGNVDGMLDILLPLHEEMDQGPETECEAEFIKDFGESLREAGEYCRRFRTEHESGASDCVLREYLLSAWGIYHTVFRKIQRQQQTMLSFDLEKVSSRLHEARNLKLAVPGTYDPDQGAEVVGIQAFGSQLNVVQSKQRPRKVSITGTDGRHYQFLLKGHEDLRQDERVMQVFGLINKLFGKCGRRGILRGVEMKTYAVIALSPNAGLIEWVPECDTMHALVKEYREVRKILPNVEHKVMLRIAPEPDRLPLLHQVDLFEFMLQNTVSADIAKVLWLKSRNSEMWLERRNTYARSLATTSMAGYLLGLGDRHPSNIMIERSTGKVLHIDFGDCFEVAMKREKFPERVPFRLTRMLVQALEPCGVDGYFRHTAEATMEVLRQKNARESLMAMMEAFVYDPLLRWKLIGPEELIQLRAEQAANIESQETGARRTATGPSSMFAASRTATHVDPIVQSLRETGSLSASVRHFQRLEHSNHVHDASESPVGALPTPLASAAAPVDYDDIDPANLQTPNERARMDQLRALRDGDPTHQLIADVSNEKAQSALNRFEDKLCGTDFDPETSLSVSDQVSLLIRDARNVEHLCALFMGWCAFW